MGAIPPVAGAVPTNPPVQPFTATDIRGARVPERGTGAFMNSSGVVTNIDTRPAPAGPGAVAPVADGSVGSYVGALMNQRQAGVTEARNQASSKMLMDYMTKVPGMNKADAEAAKDRLMTGLGAEHLKRNPTDFGGAGAVVSGRATPRTIVPPTLQPVTQDPKNPTAVDYDPTTRTFTSRSITQQMSFAQAKAQAMKNPQYKFTTDAQLRRDIEVTGKYKLTD